MREALGVMAVGVAGWAEPAPVGVDGWTTTIPSGGRSLRVGSRDAGTCSGIVM